MDTTQLLTTILASTLLATIVNWVSSIYLKRKDFENDYYKEVIKRRLAAYEAVEAVIRFLKWTGCDGPSDSGLYHITLANGWEQFTAFQAHLGTAITNSIWMEDETARLLTELGHLLYAFGLDDDSPEGFKKLAKERYEDIVLIRSSLEMRLKTDMSTIHKVPDFLSRLGNLGERRFVDLRSGKTMRKEVEK